MEGSLFIMAMQFDNLTHLMLSNSLSSRWNTSILLLANLLVSKPHLKEVHWDQINNLEPLALHCFENLSKVLEKGVVCSLKKLKLILRFDILQTEIPILDPAFYIASMFNPAVANLKYLELNVQFPEDPLGGRLRIDHRPEEDVSKDIVPAEWSTPHLDHLWLHYTENTPGLGALSKSGVANVTKLRLIFTEWEQEPGNANVRHLFHRTFKALGSL